MKTLSNSKSVFIEVKRDEAMDCIVANWIGIIGLEEVMEGAMAVINEVKEAGYTSIINDNRQVIGDWRIANEWLTNEWLPVAMAAKLEKFAHILSPYYYGKLSAEDLQAKIGDKLQMKIFQSEDEAIKWVKEDKKK